MTSMMIKMLKPGKKDVKVRKDKFLAMRLKKEQKAK